MEPHSCKAQNLTNTTSGELTQLKLLRKPTLLPQELGWKLSSPAQYGPDWRCQPTKT